MNIKLYLITFLALCFLGSGLQAQVVINEISAANRNTILDNYGEREDWFELYNAGTTAVDLSGYYLSDKVDNPTKWQIPAGVTIGAGDYLVVFASSRDEVSGSFLHTNFKLTQTKDNEGAVLADPSGMILGLFVIIQPNQLDHSWGRETDGGNNWGVFTDPTPGGPNGGPFYQKYADEVSATQEAGFYSGSVTVQLTTAEPNAVIRYTLNGSDPSGVSPQYTAALTIDETQVLRAAAFSNDASILPGFIETNTYFIDVDHDLPVLSIAGSHIETLLNGSQIQPIASIELFEANGELMDEAVGEFNEHGNDSWAYAQRGIDYITRDQFGYSDGLKHQIFPDITDREDFQRLIIKAAANDNYPFSNGAHIRDAYVHTLSQKAGMELDERTNRPCVMYANGEYWGLYEIREKVDDGDYTSYYYDQDEEWVDFIKTWGNTWEEYGSWDDWYPLHDFITSNDMSDPANYDYVKTQLNVTSLVDYMIINTHVVCMDWLNWNTAWWRGRNPDGGAKEWRYALWDLDATFGHYINYTGIPDTSPFADPCDNEDYSGFGDPEGHVDLIISLMENEDFHALYVNRYADFNNTYFTCDYMLGLLDEMIGEIESEMPAQINRWGGSLSEWEDNVQELIEFIETRCTIIDGGIADCYDVTGPFPVKVNIFPENSPNQVKVNTLIPPEFPFNGDYFGGVELSFTAVPAAGWEFFRWEVLNHSFSPDQYALAIQLAVEMDEEITAYFIPAIPCGMPAFATVDPTETSAALSWEGPFNYLSYEVKWRESGSGDNWTSATSLETEYTIYGLQPCKNYDLELRTICETATSEIYTAFFETECNSVSTAEPGTLLDFQVYPNPFVDQLTIDMVLAGAGEVTVQMHSLDGRQLYARTETLPSGLRRLLVPGSEQYPAGLYLIQVLTENGLYQQKVVKE